MPKASLRFLEHDNDAYTYAGVQLAMLQLRLKLSKKYPGSVPGALNSSKRP